MLALFGLVIFGTIYLLTAKLEKKPGLASLERVAAAGAKKIAGTTSAVAAGFVSIQVIMCWTSSLDWANRGLLTIERTLSLVGSVLRATVGSEYFMWGAGALLLALIGLPSICALSRTARGLLTGAEWLVKGNIVLTIVTSLTFFGTGTRDGLAAFEARLVEERTKVERGLEALEMVGRQVVVQVVEDTLSEIIEEDTTQQEISELIDHEDITSAYPFISWPDVGEPNDFSDNLGTLAMRQVAKTMSVHASFSKSVKDISESEAVRLPRRVEQAVDMEPFRPEATLDRIQRAQAELEKFVSGTWQPESPHPPPVLAAGRALRLSVSLAYNRAAASLLPLTKDGSAVYDIIGLFVDETFHGPLKEMLRVVAEYLLRGVFTDGLPIPEAYERAKQEAKSRARSFYNEEIKSRLSSIIAQLREEKRLLTEVIRKNSDTLATASESARAARIQAVDEKLATYGAGISDNPIAKDGLNAFRKELSNHLHAVSETDALKQLKGIEEKLRAIPQEAGTLTKIESDLGLTPHFANSRNRIFLESLSKFCQTCPSR